MIQYQSDKQRIITTLVVLASGCLGARAQSVPAPVTVEFSGKQTDPRSPAERKADVDHDVADFRKSAESRKSGSFTPDQEARIRVGVASASAPQSFRILMSTDGTKLLFRDEVLRKASVFEGRAPTLVTLFDGETTYFVTTNGHQLDVYKGLYTGGMGRLPLPGAGLAQFPLQKPMPAGFEMPKGIVIPHGFAMSLIASTNPGASETPFQYTPGVRSATKDASHVVSAFVGLPGQASESWAFASYTDRAGQAVASRTTWRSYETDPEGNPTARERMRREFRLVRLSKDLLPAPQFEVGAYALKGAHVVDHRDSTGLVNYAYDPALSFEEMRKRSNFRGQPDEPAPTSGHGFPMVPAIVLGVGSIGAVVGIKMMANR